MKQTVCIAGKNDIAVRVMDYLLENYSDFVEIVACCNRNESGVNSWQRSFRYYLQKRQVKELSLPELYEIENLVFISTEFDRIIKPSYFKTNRLFNIHFSKLPEIKGSNTSVVPILYGKKQAGVTFHRINAGIDTGEIIEQQVFEITDDMNSLDLYETMIQHGTELVIKNMDSVIRGTEKSNPQSAEGSTYYPRNYFDYANIVVDLNVTAWQLSNQIRAYGFRPYQLPKVFGTSIVWSHILAEASVAKPGEIIKKDEKSITVATVDYNVRLYVDRLQQYLDSCKIGDLEAIKGWEIPAYYMKSKNEKGWTGLTVATYNNQVEIVKYLIDQGADIHQVNYNGTNLLMYAKEAFVNTGDDTLIKLFLGLGLSPEAPDYAGLNLWDYLEEDSTAKALWSEHGLINRPLRHKTT